MGRGHRRRPLHPAEAGLRKLTLLPGPWGRHPGAMAQLVAHLLCKQGVRGSSPLGSTPGQTPFTVLDGGVTFAACTQSCSNASHCGLSVILLPRLLNACRVPSEETCE